MHKSDKIKYIYYYLFLFSVNIHIMFMFCTIPHVASSSDLYVCVYASMPPTFTRVSDTITDKHFPDVFSYL